MADPEVRLERLIDLVHRSGRRVSVASARFCQGLRGSFLSVCIHRCWYGRTEAPSIDVRASFFSIKEKLSVEANMGIRVVQGLLVFTDTLLLMLKDNINAIRGPRKRCLEITRFRASHMAARCRRQCYQMHTLRARKKKSIVRTSPLSSLHRFFLFLKVKKIVASAGKVAVHWRRQATAHCTHLRRHAPDGCGRPSHHGHPRKRAPR